MRVSFENTPLTGETPVLTAIQFSVALILWLLREKLAFSFDKYRIKDICLSTLGVP